MRSWGGSSSAVNTAGARAHPKEGNTAAPWGDGSRDLPRTPPRCPHPASPANTALLATNTAPLATNMAPLATNMAPAPAAARTSNPCPPFREQLICSLSSNFP